MSDADRSSELELRAQLAEARTETKLADALGQMRVGLAEIGGRIDAVGARLDGVERATSGLKATVIGTGIGVVAVVIAVLTYGQTWFGIGISTRDVVKAAVSEYRQQLPSPLPPSSPAEK